MTHGREEHRRSAGGRTEDKKDPRGSQTRRPAGGRGPAARAKSSSTAVGEAQRRAAARSPGIHASTTASAASLGVEQMIPTLTEEPPELLVAVVVDAAGCAVPPLLPPPHAARMIAAPSSPALRARRLNRGPRGGR